MKNLICCISIFSILSCNSIGQTKQKTNTQLSTNMSNKIEKSNEEWKKVLSPEQFNILREKGTEMPYSGKYYLHNEKGTYVCAACGNELFKSDTKFNAGCGWPSFSDVIDSSKVVYTQDKTLGMERTEITCAKCGGHLGHVFNDGPIPTGIRYCINSVSIGFKK